MKRKPRSGTADSASGNAPISHDSHVMQPLATTTTRARSDTKDSFSSTDM